MQWCWLRLSDGVISLRDLRYAENILIFVKSYEEIGQVLDMLVDALRQVGLVLSAGKKRILTTQSQHPAKLVSPSGIAVEILARDQWSMVNACTPQGDPILGTGGEKKNYIMDIVLDRLPSHLAEIVKLIKECNPMLVEFRLLQP